MTGPYCKDCKGRCESREKVDSRNALSGNEEVGAAEESAFPEERDEVETEQDRCKRVFVESCT